MIINSYILEDAEVSNSVILILMIIFYNIIVNQ